MHCAYTYRQLSVFEQLEISVLTETATLQEELGYLKALWDMVAAVMFTFTDWYATLWDKIDVDFLVEETKKLTKDIKQLNKAVRNYEVYRYSCCPLCSRCLFFLFAITVTLCACICFCACDWAMSQVHLRHIQQCSQGYCVWDCDINCQ